MKYFILSLLFCLTGCTVSFKNISTHGTATDITDETLETTPNVSPDISVPMTSIPSSPI